MVIVDCLMFQKYLQKGPDRYMKQVRQLCLSSSMASPTSNRLSNEKSPYLLQHAFNPVDWYPWGEDAFTKARKENKLIFLSVGYSTCHWCHVMERESFENKDIAQIMNKNFVNVKVDREERPDVDKTYMTFVQATSGGGGWPMSVFLTPDLKPVFGGTYFPPDDRYYGRPGFKTLLKTLSSRWAADKDKFTSSGEKILDALARAKKNEEISDDFQNRIPAVDAVSKCYSQLANLYEPEYGGFGDAPKFPQPSNFNFMFALMSAKPKSEEAKKALAMCSHSLKMMAKGGIHDHIGQGFARYSTDKEWHVPHFEKMLYDQGQLLVSFVEMYVATQDAFFADVARDIVCYVTRDLHYKEGGFYSAEDADSLSSKEAKEKKEGAFYVWTKEEISSILNFNVSDHDISAAEVFSYHYDVKPQGNVDPYKDPHDELKGKNVLIVRGSVEETGNHFKISPSVVEECLEVCRKTLFNERNQRPRPHLDDKFLTAWNGLMVSGLAIAGATLHDQAITERAVQAATFMKTHLYDEAQKTLLRSCYRQGDSVANISKPINGFADDYAFTIKGLLDLYEACYDIQWIEWADELQEHMNQLFWDSESGGYYMSPSGDSSIVLRIKEDQDGAEPSANSVAVRNLLRLANYLDKLEYRERAGKILAVFSERLTNFPLALPEMVRGLMLYHHTADQIAIVGRRGSADTDALLSTVHSMLLPNKVLLFLDPDDDGIKESSMYKRLTFFRYLKMKNDAATAYVCHNYSCMLPVTSPDDLNKLLDKEVR